jgi:hypothetical protein
MTTRKVFIPLHGEEVAPRFDLSTEVLMGECDAEGCILIEKVLLLPGPSAERLCHMAITERVQAVICGGIEQEVYDYLTWKRVEVIDNVIGPASFVLRHYAAGRLHTGDILSSAKRS